MPTDRGFLEKCFPSLQENVFPVEKYGNLEVFELSSSPQFNILPKNTAQSMMLFAQFLMMSPKMLELSL